MNVYLPDLDSGICFSTGYTNPSEEKIVIDNRYGNEAEPTPGPGVYDRSTTYQMGTVPETIKRISWGAILAGTVVALVIQLALGLLGLAIGLGIIDPATEQDPLSGLGIGAGIWLAISSLIALFAGGWTAGRLAGIPRSLDGILHGVVTWGLVTLLTFYLMTTAVGQLVSGAAGIIGEGFSLAGQGLAAVAPEVADTVQQALEEQGITLESIKEEAQELLQQTGKPELQPEALEDQAEQAVGEATEATREDIATSPGDTGEDLSQILDRMLSQAGETIEAADREAAVNVLVARTEMNREEAQQTVDRWIQQYQQATQQFQELQAEAKQTAVEISDKAAENLSQAALWAFIALVVGAIAAAIGGRIGIPKDLVTNVAMRSRA